MRTPPLLLIAVLLGVMSGCSLWKKPAPAPPTKEQIVLHEIVDFNKATIRPDSMALIEEAATMLNAHGNLGVVVEGHSDSKGTLQYNQKLSLRRAAAVRDQLVKLGVDQGRIVVIGKGASEPIATNETREGRAQNRRVVLTIYQP
jgi:OmpA-OmpF porin, OOP family